MYNMQSLILRFEKGFSIYVPPDKLIRCTVISTEYFFVFSSLFSDKKTTRASNYIDRYLSISAILHFTFPDIFAHEKYLIIVFIIVNVISILFLFLMIYLIVDIIFMNFIYLLFHILIIKKKEKRKENSYLFTKI